MKWFRLGKGKWHAVNRSRGDQGRYGQVIAWCGFGTVLPHWADPPPEDERCKLCTRLS